jgi:ABC-type dipeptide/oligopeptide/nickel transport system ATPase component
MIKIRNFSVLAGQETILKDINLDLTAPFRIGIVGASGSGKSTLAKALAMLLDPDLKLLGDIFFQDQNLIKLKEKQKRLIRKSKLKYLVQEPFYALNPYLKIKTQLKEALDVPVSDELLLSYLKKVGLEDKRILSSYPLELSGGQRQRLCLLQCLMQNPEVLIADEPTTALDPLRQKEMLSLIKNHLDENHSSLIFVSHDLKATVSMTDVIYVMHEGQIIEQMASSDFFKKASHPFTQSLINSLIENHIKKAP